MAQAAIEDRLLPYKMRVSCHRRSLPYKMPYKRMPYKTRILFAIHDAIQEAPTHTCLSTYAHTQQATTHRQTSTANKHSKQADQKIDAQLDHPTLALTPTPSRFLLDTHTPSLPHRVSDCQYICLKL